MSTFYMAKTDQNGVLCVLALNAQSQSQEGAGDLADTYPDCIYFEVESPRSGPWPTNNEEWGDHADWVEQVRNGDTILGFRDWLENS